MKPFFITIGPRGAPRLAFEAIAPDAFSALMQHEDLRQEGERVEVAPVPTEEELEQADLDRLQRRKERERERLRLVSELELVSYRIRGLL